MYFKSRRERVLTNWIAALAMVVSFFILGSSSINALPMECKDSEPESERWEHDYIQYDQCSRNTTVTLWNPGNNTINLKILDKAPQLLDFTTFKPNDSACQETTHTVWIEEGACHMGFTWKDGKLGITGNGTVNESPDDQFIISLNTTSGLGRVTTIQDVDGAQDTISAFPIGTCILKDLVSFKVELEMPAKCNTVIRFDERYVIKESDISSPSSSPNPTGPDPSASNLLTSTKSIPGPAGTSTGSATQESPSSTSSPDVGMGAGLIVLIVFGALAVCIFFTCVIYWAIRFRFQDQTEKEAEHEEDVIRKSQGSQQHSDSIVDKGDEEEQAGNEEGQEQEQDEEPYENQSDDEDTEEDHHSEEDPQM